jgi:16S rRNA C967 or C1407 C5-methylase (RsmB/RsmF family)/NOL1/NOP2/fmu family ribosome biogenesis protein
MESIKLPVDFVDRVKRDIFLGEELLLALNATPPVSVRKHPLKFQGNLQNEHPIPWMPFGSYLESRPVFTLDPHFHGGTYYPQEAGSQMLWSVLNQLDLPQNAVFLDLCAAPGGKSTLIADFLKGTGLLVSNEVIQQRARVLKENLTKWGYTNTIVSNNDPADFAKIEGTFDCIIVDAPCSGEGMFRKDHDAREEWSEQHVELCASRQKRIVMDCWNSLKNSGYLVYSTCTFNEEENEKNINWIIEQTGAERVETDLPFAEVGRNEIGHYAIPGKQLAEGFFIAVLRKNTETKERHVKHQKPAFVPFKDLKELSALVKSDPQISFVQWENFVFAIPERHVALILKLKQQLRIIKLGTEVGELSRKGIIPHESLALSVNLLNPGIPKYELTKDQALHYLKGETFALSGTQGFGLMQFEGTVLGWIKHLGNRFNNLYPKDWRIRMRID